MISKITFEFGLHSQIIQSTVYHRLTVWLRLEGTSEAHVVQPLCSSRVTQSRLHQNMFQMVLEQGRRLQNQSGHPISMLSQPHSKEVLPAVQAKLPVFQFLLVVSRPAAWHHCFDTSYCLTAKSSKIPTAIWIVLNIPCFSEVYSEG